MIEIEFEGAILICEKIEYEMFPGDDYLIDFKNLKPGDTYIGKRNQGWKMGTVSEKLWDETCKNGWIFGEPGNIYPYNIEECLKVVEVR